MALQDVVALLSSSLQAANPQLDLRSGTPYADLFLTSTAVAYSFPDSEVQHDRVVSALANWQSMTMDELQLLASNFFVTYPSGTYSTGSVRVYYSVPTDFIASPLSSFYSNAGNAYLPTTPVIVSSQQMSMQIDGSLYYVDVEVIATSTGSAYNISSSGQLVSAINIPDYVRVTNLYPFSTATDPVTQAQFYAMIQNSLSTRDFVSATSIYAMLTQQFPVINSLVVCGYGAPEMSRDIVQYSATGYMHAGSEVDVYIDINGVQRSAVSPTTVYVNGPSLPPTVTPFVSDWGTSGLLVGHQTFFTPPTSSYSYATSTVPTPLYCPNLVFGIVSNLLPVYLLDASTSGTLVISDQMRLPILATITNASGTVTSDGALDFGLGTFGGGWFGLGDAFDFILSTVSGTELSDRSPIYMIFNPNKYNVGSFTVTFNYDEKTALSSIDAVVLGGLRNTVTDVQPRQTYPLVVDLDITINNYDPLLGISGVWSTYITTITTAIQTYIRGTTVENGLYIGDIIDVIYQFNPLLRVVTPFNTFNVTLYHPNNIKEKFVVNGSFTQISSTFNPIITNRICSFYPGTINLIQGTTN